MYLSTVNEMHPHIAEKVQELLYHYDCVIVPELGGFVTDYHPAHIDKSLSMVHPPSKELRFNASLKKNDGLLANALATTKNISHEEANILLKEAVEAYFTTLNEGERVVFEKVGVLYLDSHSRMRFHPYHQVNYLLDSYRLKRVFASPIETKQEEPAEELPRIIPLQPLDSDKEIESDERLAPSRRRYWGAAAIIPLFLFSAYLAINSGAIPAVKRQVSEIFPAKEAMERSYQSRRGIPEFERLSSEEQMDRNDSSLTLVAEDGPIPLKEAEAVKPPIVEPESTFVAPVRSAAMQFHVIGGCFSEKGNAEKLVKKLKDRGFQAYILDKNKGLHRVVYGSYADRELALDALTAVKQEFQSDAWLLRKKPVGQ